MSTEDKKDGSSVTPNEPFDMDSVDGVDNNNSTDVMGDMDSNDGKDGMDKASVHDKVRRYAALAGVVLIVIMTLATLISAFADSSGNIFRGCLIVTIALPIALWVFIWSYGAMTHKHTIASFDLGATGPNADKADGSSVTQQDRLNDSVVIQNETTDTDTQDGI